MNSNLYVIILAAGESKRFKEKGYTQCKPLLPITYAGATLSMLSWVILTLGEIREPFNLLIAYPANLPLPVIELAQSSYVLIRETRGQADSLRQALAYVPENSRVLVLDCDMVLKRSDIQTLLDLLQTSDISIAVTETFDPNASRVDTVPFPTRFVEKEAISQWGIVGARAFKNSTLLIEALDEVLYLGNLHVEPYLSTAINYYPGTKVAHIVSDYLDWGTPDRLENTGARIS